MSAEMLNMAQSNGLIIEYHSFSSPVLGLYLHIPGMAPIIGLDHSLLSRRVLHRCVLAEELGHHFTTSGNCITQCFHSIQDRISINKVEYKALRWAAYHLINDDQILTAFNEGIDEIWDMADHFNVTLEMMRFRMRLFGVR